MSFSLQHAGKRGIFWFRHDLRVHDNAALQRLAAKVDALTCIFVIEPSWFETNHYGLKAMGHHRYNFLMQSLVSLDTNLQKLGHRLQVLHGSSQQVLAAILDSDDICALGLNTHSGLNERADEAWLHTTYPSLDIVLGEGTTLYRQDDLPFSLAMMPDVYTPFRKKVEKHTDVESPCPAPSSLPSMHVPDATTQTPSGLHSQAQFAGGENAGLDHLRQYFSGRSPATYKETRNALDSWDDSTKFSPWLANGSLSPKQVYAAVGHYESDVEKNDSTYWIKFELLWREFFQWQARRYTTDWFAYGGIQHKSPETHHCNDRFMQWCHGETGYDIVDACMHQLNHTGYMSNRGRQLVASCFVHELKQDWRYGAAYFEQQLIDYDVASNWGNWLYLAGVGSDPRGHRQFNLEKQADRYDPDGEFRARWR